MPNYHDRRWPAPRQLLDQAREYLEYHGHEDLQVRMTEDGRVIIDEIVNACLPVHGTVFATVEVAIPITEVTPDYDLNDIRSRNLRNYQGESSESLFDRMDERDRKAADSVREDHYHEFKGDWNRLDRGRQHFYWG